MTRTHLSLIFYILVVLACGEQHFYHEQHQLRDEGWSYTDTLIYQVDIADTVSRYDIMLDIEHLESYSYQNVYIKIITTFPDQNTVSQVLPIDFADHTGIWYGDCKGKSCQVRVVLQEKALFEDIGLHTFTICQHMRVDPVKHISNVSLLLDKRP